MSVHNKSIYFWKALDEISSIPVSFCENCKIGSLKNWGQVDKIRKIKNVPKSKGNNHEMKLEVCGESQLILKRSARFNLFIFEVVRSLQIRLRTSITTEFHLLQIRNISLCSLDSWSCNRSVKETSRSGRAKDKVQPTRACERSRGGQFVRRRAREASAPKG